MTRVVTAGLDETIAAVATPTGWGAVALVRISGLAALEILRVLCPTSRQQAPAERTQTLARVHHPETAELLDRSLVTVFRAPRSYTGEDTVEICTHGGVLTSQLVLEAAFAAGARPALPGEFTRRAVLNGKLDLLQAEAVGDLIEGRSPAMHRAAIHQMERGLSRRLDALRTGVLETEALVAYGIDFPEEDEPPVPPSRIEAAARDVLERIEGLLRTAPQGEMLRTGALVVLAGYPNSGKSSLFNSLLGLERAIVTDIPGTTRDAIEADVVIDGFPFRLVDTAGIRPTADVIETLGIEVARRYLAAADILLFCTESGSPLRDGELAFLEEARNPRTVVVRTKVDVRPPRPSALSTPWLDVAVSTVTGVGLAELQGQVLEMAFGSIRQPAIDDPIVTSERHRRGLRLARDELSTFLEAVADGLPMEVAAAHLRGAAAALEELIGVVTTDDVLGAVLSRFCVGK